MQRPGLFQAGRYVGQKTEECNGWNRLPRRGSARGSIPEEDVPGEGKATEKEEIEMMKVRFFLNEPPGKT
jgi:hypothetical protein